MNVKEAQAVLLEAIEPQSNRQVLDALKVIERKNLGNAENRMVRNALVQTLENRIPGLDEYIVKWSEDLEDERSIGDAALDFGNYFLQNAADDYS
jgi:hypothetical protein